MSDVGGSAPAGMRRMKTPPATRLMAALALLVAAAVPVRAAPGGQLGEVQEMVKAGRTAEALRTLDSMIAQNPNDAQSRFQKGVILFDQKRSAEAVTVFQKLVQDFPLLPEPLNNLAVVYVEQGQLDKARSTLEAAIRSRPNYGTAFQNLGDVYTRMASRAYARALQIEDPESAPKLALLRELYDMPAPMSVALATTTSNAPAVVAPASAVAATKPAVVAAAPAAVASAVRATPAVEPGEPAASRSSEEVAAVGAAVRDWAAAWSRKDMPDYIAAYVAGFRGSEASASEWQSVRRDRIVGKRKIDVDVSGLKVEVRNGVARAKFRQSYAADLLRVTSQKTLELERVNGKWLIRRESTG
jgi:tetratricopeptide (TPR) repeat protein